MLQKIKKAYPVAFDDLSAEDQEYVRFNYGDRYNVEHENFYNYNYDNNSHWWHLSDFISLASRWMKGVSFECVDKRKDFTAVNLECAYSIAIDVSEYYSDNGAVWFAVDLSRR
jgi:hypothetical protein